MKIIVGTIESNRDIAAGEEFMNVPWKILSDDDTLLLEGAQAFPLVASSEEVKAFLQRKLTTYKENVALHEGARELQAGFENASKVAGEINGLSISESV